MARDYCFFDLYLDELMRDIYPQPPDKWHSRKALQALQWGIPKIPDCKSVLDVGCGEAFLQPEFERLGIAYTGVAVGEDFIEARRQGRNVICADYTFLYGIGSFDLIFARHSLEHSPFPIITLMEWHRVANKYLFVINPNPDYWTYVGRNHYSVANTAQLKFWVERAGWKVLCEEEDDKELWIIAEKAARPSPFYSDEGDD